MHELRKMTVIIDDTLKEAGRSDGSPLRRAAVMAAVRNPLAGEFSEDLKLLMEMGAAVGGRMVARLVEAFDGEVDGIESYGKGALVGTAGEVEHGFALITRPFAKQVRGGLSHATAWMASNVKRSPMGGTLDVPFAYKRALYVRSHYDTMVLSMPDAPLPDEVIVCLVGANRGRLHARIGGLEKYEVIEPDKYIDRE